jgi:hypothetical protein
MANFLLGIGGTGSKCVESFIHLAACGLGPKSVWTGIIEMDQSNGNLNNCVSVMRSYKQLYNMAKSPSKTYVGSPFGSELVNPGDRYYWSPLLDPKVTFENYFKYPNMTGTDPAMFFDSLYAKDEKKVPLDKGFRGRPSMGAPIFLNLGSKINNKNNNIDDFWVPLLGDNPKGNNGEIRVFLVGSVFGGTGASGIPNVAKVIREKLAGRKVHIGAALMLPYFSYNVEGGAANEVYARPELFSRNTQATLKYYGSLFDEDEMFDSVYLFGWQSRFSILNDPAILNDPVRSPHGGSDQNNPAFLPEFLAGIASSHFFESPIPPKESKIHIAHCEDYDNFSWDAVPKVLDTDLPNRIKNAMGSMARFAYAYLNIYGPFLDTYDSTPKSEAWLSEARKMPWFYRLLTQNHVNLASESENLEAMTKYCEHYLTWVGSIARTYENGFLFDHTGFVPDTEESNETGWSSVGLKGCSQFDSDKFCRIVQGPSGSPLKHIYKRINEYRVSDRCESLGTFIRALLDVTNYSPSSE